MNRPPDCVILHIGTNELSKKEKLDATIGEETVILAKSFQQQKVEVKVSGFVPRFDHHEPMQVKINLLPKDFCLKIKFFYFDHSNINPSFEQE